MMGRSSRRKGAEYERQIVRRHEEAGITARKVPLSGALEGFPGDVTIADRFRGEVKARKNANGFKVARDWLGENDVLFLQEIGTPPKGNPEPLVMVPWHIWLELIGGTAPEQGEG